MQFLLDTNAVIALLNDPRSTLARRVRQEMPSDIGISAIVSHELFYGAFKSRRAAQNISRIDALQFAVLEFDSEDARQAGVIRAHLASAGSPIGLYDVLIAGQAVARNMILVTHNTDELRRVPGLRIEDWEN
jgi:tRNA(fMet)-specific endonuclease VapC